VTRGEEAEARACVFLESKGLEIIERNYRCRFGEIDIVARIGGAIVFVEVRARTSEAYGGAAGSITAAKRKRLLAAARHYLARHGGHRECRFDVVLMSGASSQIAWIEDAFGE
jgi:putative endonuclease